MTGSKAPPEYCLLWIDHWSTCMTKGEWSGWVQAIGSVAAIAGAALLLYLQLRAARQQAIAAEHRRLTRRHNAIVAVAMYAERCVRISCTAASMFCQASGTLEWRSDRDALDLASEELAALRGAELESFHLVQGVRRLAVAIENARRIDSSLIDGNVHGQAFHRVDAEAQQAAANADAALKEVINAIREFKEDPDIALPPFNGT